MSAELNRIYNSAPTDDADLLLMQMDCAAWAEPLRLAVSGRDETVTLPGGELATFIMSGLSVNMPDQAASGTQDLAFSIGGVTADVLEKVDEAIDADERVTTTLYIYTQKFRDAPQKTPLTLEVTAVSANDDVVNVAARVRDIINSRFPRMQYTPENTPGLKYYSR